MNDKGSAAERNARPPVGVVVAMAFGWLFLVGRPLTQAIDFAKPAIGQNAGWLLFSAAIEACILVGMSLMRRWAVLLYLALTIITLVIALVNLGTAAWWGLSIRAAIVAPSLYYWKRLH